MHHQTKFLVGVWCITFCRDTTEGGRSRQTEDSNWFAVDSVCIYIYIYIYIWCIRATACLMVSMGSAVWKKASTVAPDNDYK